MLMLLALEASRKYFTDRKTRAYKKYELENGVSIDTLFEKANLLISWRI